VVAALTGCTEGLLFNLEDDIGQRVNLYEDFPEKAKEMDRLISDNKEKGYLIKDIKNWSL